MSITATELKENLSYYLSLARTETIFITKNGKDIAVLSSPVEKKIESLKCHKSEYNKFGAEDWIEGVKCRCGFRGYEIGKKYAEAFEVLRLEMSFDEKCQII